jgi:hypothetical protein
LRQSLQWQRIYCVCFSHALQSECKSGKNYVGFTVALDLVPDVAAETSS